MMCPAFLMSGTTGTESTQNKNFVYVDVDRHHDDVIFEIVLFLVMQNSYPFLLGGDY